jgi:hypothetical protein
MHALRMRPFHGLDDALLDQNPRLGRIVKRI